MIKIHIFILLCILATVVDSFPLHGRGFYRQTLTRSLVKIQGGSGSVINCQYDPVVCKYKTTILTNHHVIDGVKKIECALPYIDQRGYLYGVESVEASVIISDKKMDFAILLCFTEKYVRPVTVNTGNRIAVMDKVFIIGCPYNTTFWVSEGVVASLNARYGYFGHNAPIFYGNSGGPCFNADGEQIGITSCLDVYDWSKFFDIRLPITHQSYSINISKIYEKLGKEFLMYFGDVK